MMMNVLGDASNPASSLLPPLSSHFFRFSNRKTHFQPYRCISTAFFSIGGKRIVNIILGRFIHFPIYYGRSE